MVEDARAPSLRITSVDGLRALAFSLVFAYHTWEFAGEPNIPALTPVVAQNTRPDFFVVLTGFVLTLPFALRPERLSVFTSRPYLGRRLRRIVLPYYAALLFAVLLPEVLVVVVRFFGYRASWQAWPSLVDWAWHLGFLQVFSAAHWADINGSLWTMSLEMQLYLLFPVVLLVARRWAVRGVVVALALSLIYRLVAGAVVTGHGFPAEFLVGANGLGRLPELLAGMGCAALVLRPGTGWSRRTALALALLMVVGYAVGISPLARVPWLAVREIGLGLAFAALIAVVVIVPAVGVVFAYRPVAWVGYRSYSLFLVHQPLMWFFSAFLVKMLGVHRGVGLLALLWTTGLVVTGVVGWLFFRLVEEPCITWAKRTRPGAAGSRAARRPPGREALLARSSGYPATDTQLTGIGLPPRPPAPHSTGTDAQLNGYRLPTGQGALGDCRNELPPARP